LNMIMASLLRDKNDKSYVAAYACTVTFVLLYIYSRCGHVVRDFESEAKTR
jgi:hypothetical protein